MGPQLLEWDSEFWGVRIARVFDPYGEDWAEAEKIETAWLLADDHHLIQSAESNGFRMMDVRVTLEKTAELVIPTSTIIFGHTDADVEALVAVARGAHRITRFYADPRLPDSRCDDLYENWIRDSCGGWADRVLVASLNRRPVGYLTLHVDGQTASIGLIAVDPDARRMGIGGDLIAAANRWCHAEGVPRMTVVTQGRNYGALRLFERAGFVVCETGVWLHKWYRDAS